MAPWGSAEVEGLPVLPQGGMPIAARGLSPPDDLPALVDRERTA
jgi:hypothetical protein